MGLVSQDFGSEACGLVDVLGEIFSELIVFNSPCLGKSIHTFSGIRVDVVIVNK